MSAKTGFRRPVPLQRGTFIFSIALTAITTSFLVVHPHAAYSQSRLDMVRQTLTGEWRANLSDEESWTLEFRNRDIVWRGGNEVVAEGAIWELEEAAGNNVFKVILHGESPDEHVMIVAFESRDRMMCPLPDGTRAVFERVGGNAMLNHGFEMPEVGQERFEFVDTVPGWTTTDTKFEVWGTGFLGVKAYEGNQFVELNAHQDGTLSQDQAGINQGATLEFSFAHRGRNGDDTMQFTITDLGPDNSIGGGEDTVLFRKQYTTGNDAWAVYDSTEESEIRALGNTVRFAYSAIHGTGATGPDKTEGNFLDATDFGVGVVAKRNVVRRFPLRPPAMPPFVLDEELPPPNAAPNLLGKYENDPPTNDWHYVTIEPGTGGNLRWVNRAGVAWTIEFRGDEIWFAKDCPYGEMKLEILKDGAGNFAGLNAGGGMYRLKESTAPAPITPDPNARGPSAPGPIAPAPKMPPKFVVETYGVHGRGNADQPKYFIGIDRGQLRIVRATLEQALKNENGVLTITREELGGGLVALKALDRYLPNGAETIGDANKFQVVNPVFPPEPGERDFISLKQVGGSDVYLRHSSYKVFSGGKYDHEKAAGTEGEKVFKQDVTWHFHEVPSAPVKVVTAGDSETTDQDSGEHIITHEESDEHGAVWTQHKIDFSKNFTISAEIYLGTKQDDGADGMALVFQGQANDIVSTGSGIGYAGLAPSIAIEFDTYQNRDECNDPVQDHVSLRLDGDPVHRGADYVEVGELEDGKYHPITFQWNAGTQTLSLSLDGQQIFKDQRIPRNPLAGQQVFFGFTAATGYFTNLHKVRLISFAD